MEKQQLNQTNFDMINNISKEEIINCLSNYELIGNITLYGGGIGAQLGGLAFIGGFGAAGISFFGGVFGFGGLASMGAIGLATGGIGLVAGVLGLAAAGLGNIFLGYSKSKVDIEELNEFEEKIKKLETQQYEAFKSFDKNLENYLIENLSYLIKNEYDDLINIAKNVNLEDQKEIDNFGEKALNRIKDDFPDFHELDKFSILVLGKTGVGKTTLINSILGQEQKGTTIGLPMTMEKPQMKHYNRELFPSLDIWDSRGLELTNEFSIEKSSQQVINFVKNGLKQEENIKNSPNFIHCIWYCLTGSRIEKSELEYIKKLKSIYSSDKKLPIIFVYTQADNEEFIEPIKESIIKELNDPNINFVDVIAKEKKIKYRKQTIVIGKKGLRKLMETSLNLARQGFESVFFGNIQKQFENTLLYFLSIKPFKNAIENIQKNMISMINKKKKKLYEAFPDLLCDSLSNIYFDIKNLEQNKIKNKSLFDKWKKEFIQLYKNNFKKFIKLINKEKIYSLIEISINNYNEKAYQDEILKIKDYDFLSVFEKTAHQKKINELLEPKRNELKKIFDKIKDNYVDHKEEYITNFLASYLTKEFFLVITQRLKQKAIYSIEQMKNIIDSNVQKAAKEIYNNLSKGINIDLIPKDEEEE